MGDEHWRYEHLGEDRLETGDYIELYDTDSQEGAAHLRSDGKELVVSNYYETIIVDLAAMGFRLVKVDEETLCIRAGVSDSKLKKALEEIGIAISKG